MKRSKLLTILLTAGILAGTLAACGTTEPAAPASDAASETAETAVEEVVEKAVVEETKVEEVVEEATVEEDDYTIRLGALTGHVLPVVAAEKGYFDEEGVNVEILVFAGGPAEIEAFTAGELDIIESGDLPFLNGVSNGLDLHVIGTYSNSTKVNGLVATTSSGIESFEDLKGKRLAVPFGTNIQALLYQYLELGGLTPDDAEILNLQNADAVNALASEDIDAAVLWTPHLSNAEKLDNTILIANTDEIRTFVCPISTSQELIDTHPEAIRRTLSALNKASAWSKENPVEAGELVNDYYGLDSADSIAAELAITDNSVPLTEEKIEALRLGFQANYQYGLLENEYNIDDFIYDGFSTELSE